MNEKGNAEMEKFKPDFSNLEEGILSIFRCATRRFYVGILNLAWFNVKRATLQKATF